MYMKSKLTDQVLEKTCMIETISAGRTSASISVAIDRKGYSTAFLVLQGLCASAGGSFTLSGQVYQTDVSTGTYTIVNSSVITGAISTTFTYSLLPTSAAVTATGKAISLSGLNRYIKAYLTVSAAVTNTITATVACILGDAQTEPAV